VQRPKLNSQKAAIRGAILGHQEANLWQETIALQSLMIQFPTQINRENILGIREILAKNREKNEPSITWPNAERWIAYLRFLFIFSVLFLFVFVGLGMLSARFRVPMNLYMPWEIQIPCFPWMIWIYFLLYTLFLLPLLHMTPVQMAALSRQSVVTLLVAGIGFLVFPGQVGFPPTSYAGINGAILSFLDHLSTTTGRNLIPSLHVAFSALILLGCCDFLRPPLTWIYGTWLVLMCASTVLTHQHHLLDMAAGLGLAVMVRWLLPLGPADVLQTSR
jgi:membrane-associated phospholipid phosphatase